MIVVSKNPLILFANNSHPALKEDINSHDNNTKLHVVCIDKKKQKKINVSISTTNNPNKQISGDTTTKTKSWKTF